MATLYAYSPNGTQATLSYEVIGFTQSLQQNGWCKLPNGLILQWGEAVYGDMNFPISFTIECFSSLGTPKDYYKLDPLVCTKASITGMTCTWFGTNYRWIASGY